jgi:NAD(P) transhydrogenase
VFSAFGCKIEIVERRERLLGFLDHEISDALMNAMRAEGIILHLDDGVTSVVRDGPDLLLTLESGAELRVDKVLVSAGRVGNTDHLGLDRADVRLDHNHLIVVDDSYRTSASSIFAAGDVIGRPALASTAMEQGRLAVAAMFRLTVPERDFATVPSGIYTIPEACSVGPTEEELKAAGVPYVAGRSYMRHNARGQIIGDTDGFIKLLFHAETRRLLGTHIIAERATELIHIGQAVMRLGGGIDYFIEVVMSYPSLSVAYKYAAYDALGRLSGAPRAPTPLS